MMIKDFKNSLLMASAVMLSCTCIAAISDTFEGETSGWDGDGSIVEKAVTAPAVGLPIAGEAGSKVLEVQGVATRVNADGDAGQVGLIDFMLQVTSADEELTIDSGETSDENPAGAPIAIATGMAEAESKKIPLKVLSDNQWTALTDAVYTEGEWVRVTIVVDYNAKRFRVSVNGIPVSKGYAEATGDKTDGPWFAFNKDTAFAKVSKLIVVGSTSVDDVVVAQGNTLPEAPIAETAMATVNGKLVPVKYLHDYGVPPEKMTTVKLGDSTLSVMDKYEAGLDPTSAETFKLTSIKATDDANTVEVGVTGKAPNGYTIEVLNGDGETDSPISGATVTNTEADGTGSKLTVTLPEDITAKVIKFRVKAEAKSAN